MLREKRMIWFNDKSEPDTYGEFIGRFRTAGGGKVRLTIAGVGHFAVYLNDRLVYFGQSADYPHWKLYHQKELTASCETDNELRILVWYQGVDTHGAIREDAGLFFEVEQEGKVLLMSGSHILSRRNNSYRNGYCKWINGMAGLSFFYDNAVGACSEYAPSVLRNTVERLYRRRTGEICLGGRHKADRILNKDGYLIDLGEEVVGFLDLEFSSPVEQDIVISYAEHLVDGKVQRLVWGDGMDFSVEFRAREGKNCYMNPFLRLAGRYLQVTCEHPIELVYAGLRPTERRVRRIKRVFDDMQLQRIYDVSVNTLMKCMHEHYEDCPWREQAMYVLDSRNQMLCGYYAFSGHRYQRENLLFIARGQRPDGILSHTFPSEQKTAIPFFSLVYLTLVEDYVEHTGDRSVLRQVKPVIDRIMEVFAARIDETGLIANFPYPFWNFYEWSEGSSGTDELHRTADDVFKTRYDLILNCMYVLAARSYQRLYGEGPDAEAMLPVIHRTFFCEEKGLYRLSTENEVYSQLGNSFAILAGLGGRELAEKVIHDPDQVPVTLSMNTYYYDALLSVHAGYGSFVTEDIRVRYGRMLEQGATTFWETEKGWQDQDGGASLCHGWSAIPAYYLAQTNNAPA